MKKFFLSFFCMLLIFFSYSIYNFNHSNSYSLEDFEPPVNITKKFLN